MDLTWNKTTICLKCSDKQTPDPSAALCDSCTIPPIFEPRPMNPLVSDVIIVVSAFIIVATSSLLLYSLVTQS